jgi:hypothetical protein
MQTKAPLSEVIDTFSCSPFEWVRTEGLSDRAGMQIPVEVNGRAYKFQFDTGANVSLIYGKEAVDRGWAQAGAPFFAADKVRVGGRAMSDVPLFIKSDLSAEGALSGTIGLDLLMNQFTVIDYPGRRICFIPRLEMTMALFGRTRWAKAELRGGKLYVPAKVGSVELNDLFFDTGASMFYLMLDHARWSPLTGIADPKKAPQTRYVSSWGKKVPIAGAPMTGELEIAGVKLAVRNIDTLADTPDSYASYPTPTAGLIGNAPLWDKVVVLDMTTGMQFGIAE